MNFNTRSFCFFVFFFPFSSFLFLFFLLVEGEGGKEVCATRSGDARGPPLLPSTALNHTYARPQKRM